MLRMGSIFSPVSLGTTQEAVNEALARVRATRARHDEEIARGLRLPNEVVVKDGVVVVTVRGMVASLGC